MENKSEKDFSAFYKTALLPELHQLELPRKKFVGNFIKVFAVFVTAAAIIAAIANFGNVSSNSSGLVILAVCLAVLGLIIIGVMYYKFNKTYTPRFKDGVIKKIIHFIDDGLDYNPKSHISKHDYLNSDIFTTRPDRFKGEDLVYGKVGETEICFSELHSEYKSTTTDSKGNTKTTWHTIFRGVFFEADFNKEFMTKTFVLPDMMERTFGFIGKKLQSMNISRPPLVKLEDPEFEKYFVVYGEDQVEARYILSTSLMKRLTDFRKKTGKAISLSFVSNSIYIAIPENNDLFEPRIFRSNLNPQFIDDYYQFLDMAIGIVEELKLNRRIWTKVPV